MTSCAPTWQFFRGATIQFATTFYDANKNVVNPAGAVVELTLPDGATASVNMVAPSGPQVQWTAQWDSRGVEPGSVAFSIHSTGSSIPYAVEDGQFTLTANNANLEAF
jgi:predicted carbohydrate-binding protein with CBM5 and CBM33 domain